MIRHRTPHNTFPTLPCRCRKCMTPTWAELHGLIIPRYEPWTLRSKRRRSLRLRMTPFLRFGLVRIP